MKFFLRQLKDLPTAALGVSHVDLEKDLMLGGKPCSSNLLQDDLLFGLPNSLAFLFLLLFA